MNERSSQSVNAQKQEKIPAKSRRTFLNRLWRLLGIIALIEAGWLSGTLLTSRKRKTGGEPEDKYISAGTVDSFAIDTVTPIPEGQFYLARQKDGSFIALSKTCTHLGCSIPWDEESHSFICPCHGSSYDIAGEILTPPATRGLDNYPLRIENGMVRVNIARTEKRLQNGKSRAVQA